jgi:hypothetical protein
MVDLMDLGVADKESLYAAHRKRILRDLETVRPATKLLMMLSGLYMPNTISMLTDKKMKETKFTARDRPEYEDFYTDERILQRESNRFSPVVVLCTHQLWEAFANCLGPMMTERTHGVFFQQLKAKIDAIKGGVAAVNSLRADDPEAQAKNLRDDWVYDSHGNSLIDYPHFAMAVWEPAEIACSTVDVAEVEGLFMELVQRLTKTDPKYGKRILSFPFDSRDAYGTPSKALMKLRRVAVLVNLVDGVTRFRSPVETPRSGIPPLPPVRGPLPQPHRQVAIVSRGRKFRRHLRGLGERRGLTATCDHLSRLGLVSLAEKLASADAVVVPQAAIRIAQEAEALNDLLLATDHQHTVRLRHGLVDSELSRHDWPSQQRPFTSAAAESARAWSPHRATRPRTAAASSHLRRLQPSEPWPGSTAEGITILHGGLAPQSNPTSRSVLGSRAPEPPPVSWQSTSLAFQQALAQRLAARRGTVDANPPAPAPRPRTVASPHRLRRESQRPSTSAMQARKRSTPAAQSAVVIPRQQPESSILPPVHAAELPRKQRRGPAAGGGLRRFFPAKL